MTREEHAVATLAELVMQYRVAFTRHCTCGDPDCAKPQLANPSDFRVVSCSMYATLGACHMLLAEGNVVAAKLAIEAAARYAGPALANFFSDSHDDAEVHCATARLFAQFDPKTRVTMEMAMQAQNRSEIQQAEDVGIDGGVDPAEIDAMYAKHISER